MSIKLVLTGCFHSNFQEDLVVDKLYEFPHPNRCTALGLSPDTSLALLPHKAIFATGDTDYKIRVFESDLQDNNVCRVINAHNGYINDLTFDTENCHFASASDDNTVKVWCTEELKLKCLFNLTSPGMVVSWHRSDPGKLLVAEKIGIVVNSNSNLSCFMRYFRIG